MMTVKRTLQSLVFVIWVAPTLFAADPVSIASILSDPQSFQLRYAILHGEVEDVTPFHPFFEPFNGNPGICYGAYTFTLKDETGSISGVHNAICGQGPSIKVPEIVNGEHVILEVQIVTGILDETKNRLPDEHSGVQAVIKKILSQK